ncbi:MAG: peptidoglycan D,D-transpeptidase FtsI family protein [Chloroflexota bacterium]
MRATFNPRYFIIQLAFATVAVAIVVQMIHLQTSPEAAKLRARGELYAEELHTFYPARGEILDRWGRVLAGNKTVYEVGVDLQTPGRNPETIAFTLSKILSGHPEYNHADYYSQVFTAASTEPTSRTVYTVIADFVTPEEVQEIIKWQKEYEQLYQNAKDGQKVPTLKGLIIRPHLMRTYPEKELASNILGFVNRQGEGFFGIEARYNALLAGEPQTLPMPTDPTKAENLPDIPDGATLVLTIDREIQAMAEKTLDRAVDNSGAQGGTIVIIDPRSGEVMGMASTPRLDLNSYWEYGEVFPGSTPFNRSVSRDYEPGSVFKVLTMAAALDSGVVTPETTFMDTGSFEIGGFFIHNWNWGAWGEQTMTGCMQHSLNVCLTWVATQLGNDNFYRYMQSFGIGRLTGIDLDGEVPGSLKIPGDSNWYEVELGTNSYGQGVAVTPLQLATAISAAANDGEIMAPHVVMAYVDRGQQYTIPPRVLGRPISPETARTLTEMLAISLEEEASNALVEGYRVAGKTGTGSIAGPTGAYDSDLTNTSFVGWGPADDPQFLVYVWLEKPTSSVWGSEVASPVFADVVRQLVVLMDIPPDNIRQQMVNGQ